MIRVGVLDDYQGAAGSLWPWQRLGAAIELTTFREHFDDLDDLASALAGFEVLTAMRERTVFNRDVFERLPDLRLLVTTGPANAAIDLVAAGAADVVVCGTRYTVDSTAELAWALILAVARNVPLEDRNIRAGGWQCAIGPQLAGRTLGLVGLGRIGSRMAAVASAFGMRVLAWSQNLTPQNARALGAEAVDKRRLFEEADYVSIHLPLSDRSRRLVGAQEIGWMKPSAYLINTSRGPIVDESALVHALRSGTIAGAGLDVFDVEPLPSEHPLRTLPNTVLTPHIGYVATDVYEMWGDDAVANIEAYLNGEPIRVITATSPTLDLRATRVGVAIDPAPVP